MQAMEMKFLRAILKKTIEDAIRNTIIRLTQNKGTFLPKIEEISGGKAHTNTRKLIRKLGLDKIKNDIQRSRLSWSGHVMQMGKERIPQKMLNTKIEGK